MQRTPPVQELDRGRQSLTRSYARLNGPRFGIMVVAWITAGVLSFGAMGTMILSDVMYDVSLPESEQAWASAAADLADAVAVLSLAFVPVCLVLAFVLSMRLVYPKDLPPWTTPEQLRAAEVLVRNKLVSNDHHTNLVARVYAERFTARVGALPLRLSASVCGVSSVLFVLGGVYTIARAFRSGELIDLAVDVNAALLFSLLAFVYPVQTRRLRKLRAFRDLHDATYHGTHG